MLEYEVIYTGKYNDLRKLIGEELMCPECRFNITINTGTLKKENHRKADGFLTHAIYYDDFFVITAIDADKGSFQVRCKNCNCIFWAKHERNPIK